MGCSNLRALEVSLGDYLLGGFAHFEPSPCIIHSATEKDSWNKFMLQAGNAPRLDSIFSDFSYISISPLRQSFPVWQLFLGTRTLYAHISMSDFDTKIPFRRINIMHFLGIYFPIPPFKTQVSPLATHKNFYFECKVTPLDGCATPTPREVLEADRGCINTREQHGEVLMTRCLTCTIWQSTLGKLWKLLFEFDYALPFGQSTLWTIMRTTAKVFSCRWESIQNCDFGERQSPEFFQRMCS